MKPDNTSFRDRLLAIEAPRPETHDQLRQEIKAMFVRKLTAPHRAVLIVVTVFSLGTAAVLAYLAATEPTLPPLARVGLGTGVLFGLAWAALGANVLRRGEMDVKVHGRLIAGMVWCFTLLMCIFFQVLAMSAKDKLVGLLMVANGLMFLIGAAVYFLSFRIEQSELSTRERLLQLELRLAEMAEARR
jgi:MFS family permease